MTTNIDLTEEKNNIFVINKSDIENTILGERTVNNKKVHYYMIAVYKLDGEKGRITAFHKSAIVIQDYFE